MSILSVDNGQRLSFHTFDLTSFCVVAVGGVVARAKALPMMHHHGRELIEEVLGAR